MKTLKKIGIWMDHSAAHLIEYSAEPLTTKIIESKFTHKEKQLSLSKSENLMHKKEQHEQAAYYKELGEIIKNYDEVLLFGPTDAKTELLNILADNLLQKIKIETKHADKMSENQEHAFVRAYFSKQIANHI